MNLWKCISKKSYQYSFLFPILSLQVKSCQWPASLLKMSHFHRCFSNILLVKTNNLFICKWNIGRKWVGLKHCLYFCDLNDILIYYFQNYTIFLKIASLQNSETDSVTEIVDFKPVTPEEGKKETLNLDSKKATN